MAVTPLELPSLKLHNSGSFAIERYQIGGGAGQTADVSDPLWVATYNFAGFPTRVDRDLWQGFLDSLNGLMTPVLAFDPARRVPLTYYNADGTPPTSGSPWGTPVVAAYDRAASTFDMTGLTNDMELSNGDYISFQDTASRWHLHKLTAAATVSGTGTVTVTVAPRPARGLTHGGASVRMRDACCTMVMRWPSDAFRYGPANGGPLTITGQQVTKAFL